MSTTFTRRPREIDWEVPTGILRHVPPQTAPDDEHIWPDKPGDEPPTYLHPAVVIAVAAGYAWMLVAFWVAFAGYGYMGLALVIATLISGVMLGLLAIGGAGGRNVAPWERHWRSVREFLAGEVSVWGGRIPGRDAFIQLVGIAWSLAALATVFGIIVAITRA